jgi:glycosidase
MIYYGDESGMDGDNDPDCRKCMNWDPNTWNHTLFNTYQKLIRTRREHPALWSGSFEALKIFNGIYAYRRACENDQVVVILNPRQAYPGFKLPLAGSDQWSDVLTGKIIHSANGILELDMLSAQTAFVLIPHSVR